MRKKRKKVTQDPITTTIESLSHDGRGIAHIQGKIAFIDGALPGEKIVFQYTQHHGQFDEGKVIEVIQPVDERVTPACPYYGLCGGCNLQHMDKNAQIYHKQQVLLDQLKHFGNIEPQEILPPITGPIWGYRHKARLGVRFVIKKEELLVGFREKNGRYITDMNCCEILEPSIGKKIESLKTFIKTLEAYESVPQIEVAIGDHQTAIILRHLKPLSHTDQEKIKAFAQKNRLEIYLQPGKLDSIHKIWPIDTEERLTYELKDQKVELRFHPSDFTQVNSQINQAMVNRAIELLDPQPTDNVLDLFCGLGNFTIPLSKFCQKIVGVELSQAMIERAQENAQHNHLINTRFFQADLMESLQQQPWNTQQYDKILLDPPRIGAKEIIQHVPKFNPSRIVYVSCNPATLARDSKTLVYDFNYELTKVGVLDMFPHTSHVESIALFCKQK